jgi:ATP phosphoribosyltransferase regulatory subunit
VSAAAFDEQLARIGAALVPKGVFTDLPILLPASMVLELAGEGLRPRLFFATAPDGSELCLRPDLTIPAVVRYIETAQAHDATLAFACKGPVFRAPRIGEDRPPEFIQIGLERFGDANIISSDCDVFSAAWRACKAGFSGPLHVRFCDGGLLPFVLAQADLDPVWRQALNEQTSHSRAFLQVLSQAAGNAPARTPTAFELSLIELSLEDATQKVDNAIRDGDLSLAVTRSAQDVARHLMMRTKRALAKPLARVIAQTLDALARFEHKGTVEESLMAIVDMGAQIDVDLRAWQADWQARFTTIKSLVPGALDLCRFDALGEEAFDYYDGMAFDIAKTDDFSRPLATGGRYDCLVGELSGGKRQARAVGCVVRPDRLGALL